MSHQWSIVPHFFPHSVQVHEKNFLRKVVPLVKLTQNYFKKYQICSLKICMSHQKSNVHLFSS